MEIIVGLGNPGEKYNKTRHNIGFMILDYLAKKSNLKWTENKKFQAMICKDNLSNIILLKPQTFMNNSGQSVERVMSYFKLLPKKFLKIEKNSDLSNILTVIHDDLDIELGQYKISIDSRSGGHKGVESIINYLKTKNFKRIRLGIKNKTISTTQEKIPTEKFVLGRLKEDELKIIENIKKEIYKKVLNF